MNLLLWPCYIGWGFIILLVFSLGVMFFAGLSSIVALCTWVLVSVL